MYCPTKSSILFVLLFFPILVSADIYECNGVWSNKPCEGKTEPVFKEIKKEASRDVLSTEAQVKTKALAEWESFIFDAKRKLKKDISSATLKEYCNLSSTTVEQCLSKIEQRKSEVLGMFEKQPVVSVPENLVIDNRHNTNVVVIQENIDTYGYPEPSPTRSGLSPDFQPGPFGKEPLIKPPTGRR